MVQVLADEVVVVHGVLTDSRPVDFYVAGVAGTIDRLATPLRAAGVAVRLDTPHHGIEIDRSSATLLYRTAQELLSNIFKYAKASAVTVRIATVNHGSEHGIQLRVCDDGAGFDVERATTGRNSGMGLRLMRSTVDLAGGTTAIVSAPGAGSQVTVTLPLD